MTWQELLEAAETQQEREEIIRLVMSTGFSKEEIEAELERLDLKNQQTH